MVKALVSILKIVVPLGLDVWLIFYFYDQLDDEQRKKLFTAFGEANWWWLLLGTVLGWCSHLSRAWRWRYLLEHLGHKVSFWNAYHATMVGYFMNMLLPRAGEASRAVTLYRAEGVPFEKGFGTIMAERAVDMILLLGIAVITVALQLDKIDLFRVRIAVFRSGQGTAAVDEPSLMNRGWLLLLAAVLVGAIMIYLVVTRPALRARLRDGVRGFIAGLQSIYQTKHKGAYLFHTLLIWSLYLAMFWLGFLALPSTAVIPPAGVMAGFVAGAISIVLVQGGIGVYPAFVALIVSVYMPPVVGGGSVQPDALAMGWLLWAAQTVLLIGLGGVSLLLISRKRKPLPE